MKHSTFDLIRHKEKKVCSRQAYLLKKSQSIIDEYCIFSKVIIHEYYFFVSNPFFPSIFNIYSFFC